jgi:hypothetical protein
MLAVALCAPAALADSDEATIYVGVATLRGKPIERASVILRFVEGRSVAKFGKKIRTEWTTRTNQEGMAKFPSIPKGKVLIQVIAQGYQTFGKEFDITEDTQKIEITLNPPQPQYSVHD